MRIAGPVPTLLATVIVAIMPMAPAAASTGPDVFAQLAGDESQTIGLINSERTSRGLNALSEYWDLTDDARAQTARMITAGEIFHNPNLAGVTSGWEALGENVGRGPNVTKLHSAFMGSSGHRANILGEWDRIGVGADRAPDGTMYITVVFMLTAGGTTTTTSTTVPSSTTTTPTSTTSTTSPPTSTTTIPTSTTSTTSPPTSTTTTTSPEIPTTTAPASETTVTASPVTSTPADPTSKTPTDPKTTSGAENDHDHGTPNPPPDRPGDAGPLPTSQGLAVPASGQAEPMESAWASEAVPTWPAWLMGSVSGSGLAAVFLRRRRHPSTPLSS